MTSTHTHTHNYWKFCSILVIMLLLSCNEDTNTIDEDNTETIAEKTINFKGLVFKNSYKLSEKDLNTPKEEGFKTILHEVGSAYYKAKGLSFRTEEGFDENRLLEATRDMLPYLPFQEDGINVDMLLRDIPDLTPETFNENQDVIDDYYNSSLDRIVARRYYDDSYLPILRYDDLERYDYTPKPPVIPTYKDYKNEGESTADCVVRLAGLKWYHVRRQVAAYTADRDAEIVSRRYYPDLNTNLTKRDAFKHTIWNALLSKYYWTVSSKKKKYNFAKSIANWNEDCGNNGVGTRHMDYRNNDIGRELYQKLATFKTILWGSVNVGVNNPTNGTIYEEAQKQIENNSVFIDLKGFAGTTGEQEEKAYLKIIKEAKTKSIYLSKKESDGSYSN